MYYVIGRINNQTIVFSEEIDKIDAALIGNEIIDSFDKRGDIVTDREVVLILPYKTTWWQDYNLQIIVKEITVACKILYNVL